MKKIYMMLLTVVCYNASAQPMLSNGYGSLAAIDGTQYKKTGSIGNGDFANVSASPDGHYFYAAGTFATADKFYYIDVATGTITDSMLLPGHSGSDMSSLNDVHAVFSLRGKAMYRIDPVAKTYDSIVLNNTFRVEERPGVKEAWVTVDSTIQVIDYSSGLSMGATIDLSSSAYDNSDVRFTKGGSIAWKACNMMQKIYKIDCATKAVIDSIDTSPVGHAAIEISSDSNYIYAAKDTCVYIYSVASKMLVDSMTSNKPIMNLYRHPVRGELWAVHHFQDSVTVFKESDKSKIAVFDIGNDPFFLAFAPAPTAVHDVHATSYIALYPNPANSHITWVLPGGDGQRIVLYDYMGRIAGEQVTRAAKAEMDITHLPAGSYIGVVYINGTQAKAIPFIKE